MSEKRNINRGFKKLLVWQDFQKLDELHYKLENQLLKLIESLQNKRNDRDWNDSFA